MSPGLFIYTVEVGELVVPVGAPRDRILCQAETRCENKTWGVPQGRRKRKLRFETWGKMEKQRTKEKKKRASKEICLLRWIFPPSRFFCQFLKSTSRSALWLFEESLHSSITRPSLRCFVPGYAWMSSGGDPWAESSQDSIHPHLSVGSSRYRLPQRHGDTVMKRREQKETPGSSRHSAALH